MSKYIETKKTGIRILVDDDFELPEGYNLTMDAYGYAILQKWADGKNGQIKLHRFVAGPSAGECVDHRNRDKLDNRYSNLRICSRGENNRNVGPRGRSKYKGVCWSKQKGKWLSRIKLDGVSRHIGFFDSETDAAAAYNRLSHEYHGEFAYENVVA